MVGRLAAVIVEDNRAPERARDDQRGKRCKKERRVGCRENVNEIGSRELAQQERDICELRRDSPRVFDRDRKTQRTRRQRVVGDQPRAYVRIVLPGTKQAIGLHGLPAGNSK